MLKKSVFLFVVIQLLFLLTGITFAQADSRSVDAGGYRLNMLVAGKGSPTVILEAGLGMDHKTWGKIQADLARDTRVVSYDRAGMGTSEVGSMPRTAKQIATELHMALKNADIKPPYILVGHSLGGVYSRVFAGMYPKEVIGLVLVDATQEGFLRWLQTNKPEIPKANEARLASAPATIRSEWSSRWESFEQAKSLPLPQNLMIALLASAKTNSTDNTRQIWLEEQRKWLKEAGGGEYIETEKSGHFIQNDEPEMVIEAIRKIHENFRKKQK